MKSGSPLQGITGWVLHRLLRNYWSLPVLAVLSAPVVALLVLLADRDFLTDWLIENDLTPVATADTARDFAGVAAGVDAALVALYFSITLIVLSLAAGNLGVRLIDRWLEKPLVRVSISGLSFSLIVSLIAMLAIDPEVELVDTPLGLVLLVMGLQIVNLAMLSVAFHDLGRTMFIDRAISTLSEDASKIRLALTGRDEEDIDWSQTVTMGRAGYVEGNDIDRLRKLVKDHPGRIRILASPGVHLLEGQAVVLLENAMDDPDCICECIPVGEYRSNSQGVVFQVRLLVEVAARALSPAINDFYTALAAADSLAEAMRAHQDTWVPEGQIAVLADDARIELPGQDFRGLFEDPMSAFRQAAADYPSVSIRMIGNYRRICEVLDDSQREEGFASYLGRLAKELADHARSRAETDSDRQDIAKAWDEMQAFLETNGRSLPR